MRRKVASLMVCLTMVLSLSGCNSATEETSLVNQEDVAVIESAIQKLENWETPYVIATTMEAPDGVVQYIECVNDNVSYTEYSVDSDGNYGTLVYASQDTITYALTDWYVENDSYHIFYGNEDGTDSIYKLPTSYNEYVADRNVMYVSKMLKSAKLVQKQEDTSVDLGYGTEPFSVYKLVVPSETIKEILGVASWGIYKSVQSDSGADSNVGKLCGYYLTDLDMNLTFSDGIVLLGIDKAGVLQYMVMEVGGLGYRMYVTKAVVEDNNTNLRQTPDFTSAQPYSATLTDLADYVASYPSYEDALNSLTTEIPIEE